MQQICRPTVRYWPYHARDALQRACDPAALVHAHLSQLMLLCLSQNECRERPAIVPVACQL